MLKPVLGALGLIAGITVLPAPLAAQQQKVLIIYGNDKCPTNAAGEEVVVCARRPESERFRIPSELRSGPLPPSATPGNAAAMSAMQASGPVGGTACSKIGGGGGNMCFSNQMNQARAERQHDANEAAESPAPR